VSGWDDPETAAYYEAFCRHHSRYLRANRELIVHAQIAPGMRVLDVAAGTGRTADTALRVLDERGSIVCFEPSVAMRAEGMRRAADNRIHWTATLPDEAESFDRILCGASIWLLHPLPQTFQRLARLLRPGGALCFNIPALYLLEPDESGGGSDPYLLSLPELLLASAGSELCANTSESQSSAPLTCDAITAWLHAAGLRPCPWSFRTRLSQTAYANWLKIPVLTAHLFAALTPKARAERIDAALASVDRSSWKWERWRGWTAWKDDAL
jgi:SAM-dependent methyltransferase